MEQNEGNRNVVQQEDAEIKRLNNDDVLGKMATERRLYLESERDNVNI